MCERLVTQLRNEIIQEGIRAWSNRSVTTQGERTLAANRVKENNQADSLVCTDVHSDFAANRVKENIQADSLVCTDAHSDFGIEVELAISDL